MINLCCALGRWICGDMGPRTLCRWQLQSPDRLRNVQQICSTYTAFAAILADGSVVTWGHTAYGGKSSGVQDQLKNVQQICGTRGAFAAILADGSVVTWGHPMVVTAPECKTGSLWVKPPPLVTSSCSLLVSELARTWATGQVTGYPVVMTNIAIENGDL